MDCPRLLLASASPRRQRLIELLGLPGRACPPNVDESAWPGEAPANLAQRLARAKAAAVSNASNGEIIIAADSVVVLDDQALGKPASAAEAVDMLWRLRGRSHEVLCGVALLEPGRQRWHDALVRSRVIMRAYDPAEVAAYVQSGAPLDKAGAYGIQDAAFSPVERLDGCYLNVVGLPLCEVVRGLEWLGHALPQLSGKALQPPCLLCEAGAALFGHTAARDLFLPGTPQ